MPIRQTAKKVAENALSTIGAFPASQPVPDEGELRKTLVWLEMLLNTQAGIRPMAGFWRVIEIPIEAGTGDYLLSDFDNSAGTQHVFSVNLVDDGGNVTPLDIEWENRSIIENLEQTGEPRRCVITKDVYPTIKIYPTPLQAHEDAGMVLRVRIQTYHDNIDETGIADSDLLIRPSWYLWLTKRLAYEIGCGPVRRLVETELSRFKKDADDLETLLLARDGQYQSPKPPVTEPMPGYDIGATYTTGRYK